MRDIVIGAQQVDAEIRFEVRLKMFCQIRRHLVFIRIHHIRILKLCDRLRNLIQCIRCKQIIVVQQTDKVPDAMANAAFVFSAIPRFFSRLHTRILLSSA